jgi:hypothetical protein
VSGLPPQAHSHVDVLAARRVRAAQAPDAELLQEFLGRLPLIFNVAILSPHGFFGQKDVLGKPDTGGQVRAPARPGRGSAAGGVPQGCRRAGVGTVQIPLSGCMPRVRTRVPNVTAGHAQSTA